MNKKSNYLIIALLFVILAMGWQLYIRTQPTEKEKEEIKEESEKIPDPEGIKIYEKNSYTDETNLFIGVSNVSYSNANCNFILPNGAEIQEYMKVGEGFGFFDNNGQSFDVRLLAINNDEHKKEYIVFDIKKGNQFEHPYSERLRDEKLQKESDKHKVQRESLESLFPEGVEEEELK